MSTKIEWVRGDDGTPGTTWNPVRGCLKVSPGCRACYAETFAERWRGTPGHPYEQGFDPVMVPDKLTEPLHWKKPRTVFVNSMSDIFGEFVSDDYIARVFGVMAATQQHTFQCLTKRARRMREWFGTVFGLEDAETTVAREAERHGIIWDSRGTNAHMYPMGKRTQDLAKRRPWSGWPLPNVWLGVSVEDRKYGLPRIDELRQTDAALRFLSIEPLLEDLGRLDLTGIHWVICGGESGPRARPMHPAWARSVRDQCVAAGVPFFFKQWGQWGPVSPMRDGDVRLTRCGKLSDARWHHLEPDSALMRRYLSKAGAGRELDGRVWDEMPVRSA